jgi:guanosine-3',5'-bis(diphosphate) 3'-pyrophosphohydrolase
MERDVLQKRIARLTTLENVGGVFRDGRAIYERARAFAIKAHLGQMQGDEFYTCHLEEVENVLIRFDSCSFRMRAAAWLHDTVEKSNVTMKDINREFPGFVASLVDAVTIVQGESREQRNSATYLRVKEQGSYAVVLKLADRIANVEEAIRAATLTNDSKLPIHEDEYSEFRDALYESKNADAMWAHMDIVDEIGNQTITRLKLATLANSVSSPTASSILEVAASVSRPSRR